MPLLTSPKSRMARGLSSAAYGTEGCHSSPSAADAQHMQLSGGKQHCSSSHRLGMGYSPCFSKSLQVYVHHVGHRVLVLLFMLSVICSYHSVDRNRFHLLACAALPEARGMQALPCSVLCPPGSPTSCPQPHQVARLRPSRAISGSCADSTNLMLRNHLSRCGLLQHLGVSHQSVGHSPDIQSCEGRRRPADAGRTQDSSSDRFRPFSIMQIAIIKIKHVRLLWEAHPPLFVLVL